MKKMYGLIMSAAVALFAGFFAGCAGAPKEAATYNPVYPDLKIAVISDLHYYDTSLGATGEAFEKYLSEDRKLLVESAEILETALAMIIAEKPDILLIPGDLTKDGERVNHEAVAARLAVLAASGIKVYVVPGNHDVLNPHAFSFEGDAKNPVPTVTAEEFAAIYAGLGYKNAFMRDPKSLSYVAEPVPGLWILALDACEYEKNVNKEEPETGGKFSKAQLAWIKMVLTKALTEQKVVIGLMHHGIMEHYKSQAKHFGQYIVDDYKKVSAMFAAYKVPVVFTGHYHAQDIALTRFGDGGSARPEFVYDIETGSLVTYPNPVRFLTLNAAGRLTVESRRITEVPALSGRIPDFPVYAKDFVYGGINGIAIATMLKMGMKEPEPSTLAPQITDAFLAHYAGDEHFTGTEMLKSKGLSFMGRLVVGNRKDLVYGLWKDLEPADNNITIDLRTGEWEE